MLVAGADANLIPRAMSGSAAVVAGCPSPADCASSPAGFTATVVSELAVPPFISISAGIAGGSGQTAGSIIPLGFTATSSKGLAPPVGGSVLASMAGGAFGTDSAVIPLGFTATGCKGLAVPVGGSVLAGIAGGSPGTDGTIIPLGFVAASSHCLAVPVGGLILTLVTGGTKTTQGAIIPAFHHHLFVTAIAKTDEELLTAGMNGNVWEHKLATNQIQNTNPSSELKSHAGDSQGSKGVQHRGHHLQDFPGLHCSLALQSIGNCIGYLVLHVVLDCRRGDGKCQCSTHNVWSVAKGEANVRIPKVRPNGVKAAVDSALTQGNPSRHSHSQQTQVKAISSGLRHCKLSFFPKDDIEAKIGIEEEYRHVKAELQGDGGIQRLCHTRQSQGWGEDTHNVGYAFLLSHRGGTVK